MTRAEKLARGRAADGVKEKKSVASARYFAIANEPAENERRGLAYRSANFKELAVISQQRQKLEQMLHGSSVVQHSASLSSMQGRLKSLGQLARLHSDMGSNAAAEDVMNQITALLREVEKAENEMKSLKSGVSNSAAVDLFLKQGAVAMRLKETAAKKNKKTSNTFDSTSKKKKKPVELVDLANGKKCENEGGSEDNSDSKDSNNKSKSKNAQKEMTLPTWIKENTPIDAVQEYVDNINNGRAKAKNSDMRGTIQWIAYHQSNSSNDNDKSNDNESDNNKSNPQVSS